MVNVKGEGEEGLLRPGSRFGDCLVERLLGKGFSAPGPDGRVAGAPADPAEEANAAEAAEATEATESAEATEAERAAEAAGAPELSEVPQA